MENKKYKSFIAVVVILLAAIILVVVLGLADGKKNDNVVPTPIDMMSKEYTTEKSSNPIIVIEKEIDVQTIKESINNMGKLVTAEYYFTDVLSNTSVKKLFGTLEIKAMESNYIVSYDGIVSAGIDLCATTIEADADNKIITVTLPESEIFSVDIDPESFQLISEKQGVFNEFSVEDYNDSIIELEKSAREKANAKGIIAKADENADEIICNFIKNIPETENYSIVIVRK